MTAAEWLTEEDPHKLLYHLGNGVSARKLRLFCCSCVRRIWYQLASFELAQDAVEVAEKYADNECSIEKLAAAASEVDQAIQRATNYEEKNALRAAAWAVGTRMDAIGIARSVAEASALASGEVNEPERTAQAHLLRDIFGNPLRLALPPADWLPSGEDVLVKLAQTAYEERAMPSGLLNNSRLRVLAATLEQAGCTEAEVVAHCREPEQHVRGCWVLDMILGKA
jgi:hypothetical protein